MVIGVLFRLVWIKIDGTGLDGFNPFVFYVFTRAIYFAKYCGIFCAILCQTPDEPVTQTEDQTHFATSWKNVSPLLPVNENASCTIEEDNV